MTTNIPRAGITPRAKVLLPLFLLVLLGFSYWRLVGERESSQGPHTLQGRTMGTTFTVVVAQAKLPHDDLVRLQAAVEKELHRIESLMSTYRDDSEVMRFNAAGPDVAFPLSASTVEVVRAALALSAQTEGAFDITVRPLVAAWGFGAGAQVQPPDADALLAVRRRVGAQWLALDAEGNTLAKRVAGVEIDLSAIAKGYASDAVSELLLGMGYPNTMVEVGGEVRVRGRKVDGPWRIGIELPDERERSAFRAVALEDEAMATSGDYRNYYERDGVRVSHTIDPRNGRPIAHGLASVTVIHPSAMWADGYATALNVMGPEAAMQFADDEGLAVLLLVRDAAGGFTPRASAAYLERFDPP